MQTAGWWQPVKGTALGLNVKNSVCCVVMHHEGSITKLAFNEIISLPCAIGSNAFLMYGGI